MNIILIAPPAAGKGTQAKLLSSRYNLPHISVGDLIRNNMNDELKDIMNSGKLIDDSIIFDLLEKRLNQGDCENGYILDGFPRNLNQAYTYEKMNHSLDYVILLDVDKDITKNRILGRKACPKCGHVYNDLFINTKPINDNLCDHCNIPLIKREDDNEETFEKRYQTYLNETSPIIDYYQNKGILNKVDSSISPETTFNSIKNIIEVKHD